MFSTKKVGVIRFVKLGRFGFSFWVAKKATRSATVKTIRADARVARDSRNTVISGLNQANAILALLNVVAFIAVVVA